MPPPATRPSTRRTAFERAGPGDHADEDEGGMGGEAPSPDWETALEAAAAQHMEAAMGGAAPSRGDTPGAGAGSTYLSAEESAAALERKLRAIQTATAREQPNDRVAEGDAHECERQMVIVRRLLHYGEQ